MKIIKLLRWLILAPWRLLVGLFWYWPLRLVQSARFWVLFLFSLVVFLIAYSALSNRYTPFTTDAYVQAFVVQVSPQVEGQVVRVHVQENQLVKKGDLLFEIEPRPFEHRIALLEARLVQTQNQVEQLLTEVNAMKAEEARVSAEDAFASAVLQQEQAIFKQESTTERRYLDALQKQRATRAALEKSQATLHKSRQAYEARIGPEHALVAEVKAQLAEARLNLEWTRVLAPASGWITNLQLRVGSHARVGQPVLTCIEKDACWIVANFRENSLETIKPGQPVEMSFTAYPGRIFNGTVDVVGRGVAEGQGIPSGDLPLVKNPPAWIRGSQRFQVRIVPERFPDELPLRVGSTVSLTAFTDEEYPLNPVARLWQRCVGWFDYLY